MIDYTLLTIFIPTFIVVSATPGLCMTLAMTLGMTLGIRKTLWMMIGELAGVATITILSMIGLASIMLDYPNIFTVLKYIGGGYLAYIGIQLWQSKGKMALNTVTQIKPTITCTGLVSQGFITAIANPKGWAFVISLLPPFINTDLPLVPQLSVLTGIILITEAFFMLIYASAGKSLRQLLLRGNHLNRINQISGGTIFIVGLWLAFG